MITVTSDQNGLTIHVKVDKETADLLRRGLILIIKALYNKYEITRKVFEPDV